MNSTISNSTLAQLKNPLAPMLFLPSRVAYQTAVSSYIAVGILGAFIWELCSHVDSDYKLLFKKKLSLGTVVYFLSRESVLLLVLLETIFQTTTLPDCEIVQRIVSIFYITSSCLSGVLFYTQICSLVTRNRTIAFGFLVSLLAVLGGGLASLEAVSPAEHIGPTHFCMHGAVKPYASAAPITWALLQAFLFLVMVWPSSLHSRSVASSVTDSKDTGRLVPGVHRRVDGRVDYVFYFVAVISNWLAVMVLVLLRSSSAYWYTFTSFNLTISNIMVSHLYRSNVLDNLFSAETPLGSIHFAPNPNVPARTADSKYIGNGREYGNTDGGHLGSMAVLDISLPVGRMKNMVRNKSSNFEAFDAGHHEDNIGRAT